MRNFVWMAAVIVAISLGASLSAPGANAQVSKDEIIKSLQPKGGLTRSLRTRAIEVVPGNEAEVLEKNPELPKLNLTVEFEYNSDRPTLEGSKQLVALGDALRDPQLKNFRFMVAGHTDARGSDDYNMGLSQARAVAVQKFLIGAQVDPQRISTVGFGKRRLLDVADPASARNRRVEIVNLLN